MALPEKLDIGFDIGIRFVDWDHFAHSPFLINGGWFALAVGSLPTLCCVGWFYM
jgi:hypothetical protein